MTDQGQLWNAGTVKIKHGTWDQKRWDQRKVADGRNRQRMLRRTAAKHGMSVTAYLAYREQQRADSKLRAAQRGEAKRSTPVTKRCPECRSEFTTTHSRRVLCGKAECRRTYQNRTVSESITRRYHSDPEFRDQVLAQSQARRAEKLGLGNRKITIAYLLQRDNWRCGICGKKIRKPEDASLDHMVPLAQGGTHTLENVQAAHRRCNYQKGDRGGGEQLLIVG